MEITFLRGENATYSMTVLREDGVMLRIPGGDRKFALPHDLAHFVVERGLGLQRGFWGRIAAGAVYSNMTILSGRRPPHATERSQSAMREAEPQGVAAEVLTGLLYELMHSGRDNDPAAVRSVLENAWRPGKPERDLPDVAEAERICTALRDAARQWRELPVGESLTVFWPSARRG